MLQSTGGPDVCAGQVALHWPVVVELTLLRGQSDKALQGPRRASITTSMRASQTRPVCLSMQGNLNSTKGQDDFRVDGSVVYLHYPTGLANATFMPAGLTRALGVPTTSRNWTTVCALAALAESEA